MKIGINGYEAVIPRFGYDKSGLPRRVGSSEVCFQLIKEFRKQDKKNNYIIYLPTSPTSDMPDENKRWTYKIIKDKRLWTIFGLTPALRSEPKLDVLFSPTHYSPLFPPCPEVITILDVSYKHFPELFKKKDLLKLNLWGAFSIKKASKIITISNSSKGDIIKKYNIPEAKISVVHLGIKNLPKPTMKKEEIFKKYSINSPYILFVGTIQPRKNLERLIESFSKIGKQNLKLVIIGRRGWKYEEIFEAPKKHNVVDSVLFLENVTDEELPIFYENAECFVLPSLYEGFGLPVLEAMKNGCPVLTSNISSLPEAGGDAAIYFDPYNVDDMANKIKQILDDPVLRAEMGQKGLEQVKKFSWEKAAKEVLSAIEEVGKS